MDNVTHRNSVLVVEDNEDLVIGLQDFLHHDGYAVTVTGTVAGAIELVRTHHFNAVLLDLGLPDGDGLEVLQEAQRLDPTLPIVTVHPRSRHWNLGSRVPTVPRFGSGGAPSARPLQRAPSLRWRGAVCAEAPPDHTVS